MTRFLAAAVTAACLGGVFATVPDGGNARGAGAIRAREGSSAAAAPFTATRSASRPAFLGETYVTANGSNVAVRVSEAFPDAVERGRGWAEFFSLMPHGDELARVQISVVTAADIAETCGERALGCYRPGELVFADEVIGGVSAEEVARHEYGHHVAAARLNAPWRALDWGPKRWASAVGICADVKGGRAFPGDEGARYTENPGEIWAETYRVLAERSAGLLGSPWSIVAGRYIPDEALLAAAGEDVLNPWTAPTTSRYRGRFARTGAKVWQRAVKTPRDGTIVVTLSMPVGPRHTIALVAADGRTVLARWTTWTTRSRTISTTICGQRSVFVRVTRGNAPTGFAVTLSTP